MLFHLDMKGNQHAGQSLGRKARGFFHQKMYSLATQKTFEWEQLVLHKAVLQNFMTAKLS